MEGLDKDESKSLHNNAIKGVDNDPAVGFDKDRSNSLDIQSAERFGKHWRGREGLNNDGAKGLDKVNPKVWTLTQRKAQWKVWTEMERQFGQFLANQPVAFVSWLCSSPLLSS